VFTRGEAVPSIWLRSAMERLKTIGLWLVLLGATSGLIYFLNHSSWFSWRTVILVALWLAAGTGLGATRFGYKMWE
jgi:hypothetical protein